MATFSTSLPIIMPYKNRGTCWVSWKQLVDAELDFQIPNCKEKKITFIGLKLHTFRMCFFYSLLCFLSFFCKQCSCFINFTLQLLYRILQFCDLLCFCFFQMAHLSILIATLC